jgi:hypothetical protein
MPGDPGQHVGEQACGSTSFVLAVTINRASWTFSFAISSVLLTRPAFTAPSSAACAARASRSATSIRRSVATSSGRSSTGMRNATITPTPISPAGPP